MPYIFHILPFLLLACQSTKEEAPSSTDTTAQADNQVPTAEITSHSDGAELHEGTAVTLLGHVQDIDHEAEFLSVRWLSGGTVLCDSVSPSSDGTTSCDVIVQLEHSEVSLEVIDPENARGEARIFMTVIDAEAPSASLIAPVETAHYYSDQKVSFEGLVSDEEDAPEHLIITWVSDIDGELEIDAQATSTGELAGATYLSEGTHLIELRVEDSTGKTDIDSAMINVGPPNSAPLCEILSPSDNTAFAHGETVNLSALVSDADIDPTELSVIWSSDKDGDLAEQSPNAQGELTIGLEDLSLNIHSISLKVSDELGESCTAQRMIRIGTPPSIAIHAPSDGSTLNEGLPITYTALVSDAEDLPTALSLNWQLNGQPLSTQGANSAGEATFTDSSLSSGAYDLLVTVTDSSGLSASDQIQWTVNGMPSTPNVQIVPTNPKTEDDLNALITLQSVDPEGDAVSYSYQWLADGVVQSAFTGAILPASATQKEVVWTVQVTPNDGQIAGLPASASVSIDNTAPLLSSLTISPAEPSYNDSTLLCEAEAIDPDEIPILSYEWLLGTAVVETGSVIDLSNTAAMPNDIVSCRVTVTDSSSDTAVDSTSHILANRAPSISSLTIDPASAITSSTTLTCAALTSDLDGEATNTSYEWMIQGNTYSGSSLTLDPSMVSPGDSVFCAATTIDAYGGSDEVEIFVIVENTAPELSEVSLNYSGDLRTSTLLNCDHVASDADQESLSASYLWTNLTTAEVYSSTTGELQLDPTSVSPNDSIACEVTVTDPSGGTASMSTSETVLNSEPVFTLVASLSTTGQQVGAVWTCSAEGTDPDEGSLAPSYTWEDSEGHLIGEGPEIVISAENSTPQESIFCVALLEDAHGGSLSSSISETVLNSPPVVLELEFETSIVRTNDQALVLATVEEPDETNDTVFLYEWYVTDADTGQESLVQSGSDSTLDGSLFFDKNDALRVVLTVSDSFDSGVPFSSDSLQVSNTAPVVTQISVSPDPAYAEYDALSCSVVDFVDADSDPVSFLYTWENDNGDSFAGAELDWTLVTAGAWTCTVEASDSEESSTASEILIVEPSACDGVSCGVDGTCTSEGPSYTCSCRGGFEGTHCELDIDECLVNNGGCVGNRSACVNTVGSHYCVDDAQVLVYPESTNVTAETYYNVAVVLVNGKGEFPVDRSDYYYNSFMTYRQVWYDHEEVGQFIFDSPDGIKSFFDEISYGKASFSGVVVDWYDDYLVPKTADDIFFDHDFYIAEAYSAIDPTQYDIFMVVGLADSGSTQIGWGMGNSVPDESNGRLFNKGITYLINSSFFNEVGQTRFDGWILPSVPWAHELFHTIGIFGHSNSLWCYPSLADYNQATTDEALHLSSNVVLSDMCQSKGYGDPFSLMGERLWATHPSVASKIEMDWLGDAELTEIDATGFFLETIVDLYPHNRSSIDETVAVQISVPEFEVLNASGNSYVFDRITLETRAPEGFDLYLNSLGTGYRPYGTLASWYLEGQSFWSSEYSANYFELDHPIDASGVFVYLDHSDTSSQTVYLLDGNPANLGSLTSQYSPKGHKGNAGKFANAMIPVGGTLDSALLPLTLHIENGENGGADGEVRVRIAPLQ